MQAAGQTIPRFPRDDAGDARPDHRDTHRSPKRRQTQAQAGGNKAGVETPSAEDVRSALAKALKSPEFQSAPQLRAFLRFVVQATLNSEQEKIKGYTIAVEALGRPDDFNPVTDPIVRVEAARLRRRLDKYYAGSGVSEPVLIAIPKGSYAPAFHLAGSGLPEARVTDELSAFDGGRTIVEDGLVEETASNSPRTASPERDCGTLAKSAADMPSRKRAPSVAIEHMPDAGPAAIQDVSGLLKRLSSRRISLGLTLAVGAVCFFAGYFAASH